MPLRRVSLFFACAALVVSACGSADPPTTLQTGVAHWESRGETPMNRQEFAADAIDGRILVMGDIDEEQGITEMWWYDPAADAWSSAAPAPHVSDHADLVALDGIAYTVGGYPLGEREDVTDAVFAYDPAGDSWAQVASLPRPTGAMACTAGEGVIYCAGGAVGRRGLPSSDLIFAYHPGDDRWEVLNTTLPTARDHASATIVDGVLWVIGGRREGLKTRPALVTEGYVLTTGEWTTGADLPTPMSGGGIGVVDGKVVMYGGEGPAPGAAGAGGASVAFATVNLYDPAADTWSRLPDMPTPVHGQASATVGREVHSIGGGSDLSIPGSRLHQVLVFEP